MTAQWRPSADLDKLLDGLEAEILGASDEEVRAALREAGRVEKAFAHEIRALLRAEASGLADDASARAGAAPAGLRPRRH